MRRYSLLLLVGMAVHPAAAQKPVLDADAIERWASVDGGALSRDGRYFRYTLRRGPFDPAGGATVVLRSTRGPWQREIAGARSASFTRDSRLAVYLTRSDSLCLLPLGGATAECVAQVGEFKLVPSEAGDWLLYRLNTSGKALVVRHLATGRERRFAGVTDYAVSGDGASLVLQIERAQAGAAARSVVWVRLAGGPPTTIWAAEPGTQQQASHIVFDSGRAQLAFLVEDPGDAQGGPALWYYRAGMEKAAALLADGRSVGVDTAFRIEAGNYWGFSRDGQSVFFTLAERALPSPKADAVMVDVWSYRDTKLQSQQLQELAPRSYAAVLHIADRRVVRLQQEDEDLLLLHPARGDVATTIPRKAFGERNWNAAAQASSYLVSLTTGERRRLRRGRSYVSFVQSGGRYVLVCDQLSGNYFGYDTRIGRPASVTAALPIPRTDPESDTPEGQQRRWLQVAAWVEHEAAVLIYDRYDIWQVDPAGKTAPVNLTNGYGRRHNLVFRLAGGEVIPGEFRSQAIPQNATLLLTAFDRTTKQSGFYRLRLGRGGDPERLTMGPYTYELDRTLAPPKLGGGEVHLVRRSSTAEAPNYFATSDFQTFTPLTAVYPEAAYNWLRAELLTWQTFDGRTAEGVLYKPENFDSTKQYPVILHYYQKMSQELHRYHRPEFSPGWINIPWFVSRGYLVFTPDIHYTIGSPGKSAYDAVGSAAQYLARFPWVDASKMGIQGHSWGSSQTNYLVTHTDMFAAATSSSGVSDVVSAYGAVWPGQGYSRQVFYELEQSRIGATLWERPDLYIENSPVFRADKVTTPLLMLSNKEDGVVPFAQGVEFFTALRRLGKRVWMLQYDGEGHGVSGKAAEDYTLRMTQFFDHYLKGAPAPKWMTEGVPARRKGIDTGLELDPTVKTPGSGLLIDTSGGPTAARK